MGGVDPRRRRPWLLRYQALFFILLLLSPVHLCESCFGPDSPAHETLTSVRSSVSTTHPINGGNSLFPKSKVCGRQDPLLNLSRIWYRHYLSSSSILPDFTPLISSLTEQMESYNDDCVFGCLLLPSPGRVYRRPVLTSPWIFSDDVDVLINNSSSPNLSKTLTAPQQCSKTLRKRMTSLDLICLMGRNAVGPLVPILLSLQAMGLGFSLGWKFSNGSFGPGVISLATSEIQSHQRQTPLSHDVRPISPPSPDRRVSFRQFDPGTLSRLFGRFCNLFVIPGVSEFSVGHGELNPLTTAPYLHSSLHRNSHRGDTFALCPHQMDLVVQTCLQYGPTVILFILPTEQSQYSYNQCEVTSPQTQQEYSNPTDILLVLHLKNQSASGLAMLPSKECPSSNVNLSYLLDRQSRYVIDPMDYLVCFGSGSYLENEKTAYSMMSSLIRSICILIGAPCCSSPSPNGWSHERDLVRGFMEPHAGFRLSFIRFLVVMGDSLIRSIGILVGIYHNLSPLLIKWDIWVDLKLGGFEPEVLMLLIVHQFCSRQFLADLNLASSSDVIFPVSESTTFLVLFCGTLHPVWALLVRRFHPRLEEFHTALKRDLIGSSKAVISWSTSEKCEKLYSTHLGPIEDNLGEYHRWTMSFGDLSFCISCTFVARLFFFTIVVWFEDAIKTVVLIM